MKISSSSLLQKMKLYFRYGAMNCSKTANLLMVAHNYRSQGREVLILKPKLDTRFGEEKVKSRSGLESRVDILIEEDTNLAGINIQDVDCILVDEVQFLTENHIEQLRMLTRDVPVICYGLKTDYRSRLFPGSKRLLELADTIEEVKTICVGCNKKAILNAKYKKDEHGNKVILKSGDNKPDLGAEEKYQPMCWNCWAK